MIKWFGGAHQTPNASISGNGLIIFPLKLRISNNDSCHMWDWNIRECYFRKVGKAAIIRRSSHSSNVFLLEQSRKEKPQKLTQLSSRSHPRHLVGKRTAQKDTMIDITSDSQVNSNFPYRWSPASLTFNNYFYLFLYLYITWITINNNAPYLKSPKNQNRRAALGRPAIKTGRFTKWLTYMRIKRRNKQVIFISNWNTEAYVLRRPLMAVTA